MEEVKPVLTIAGCGPGAREYLTLAAIDAANRADYLVGAKRLLSLFPEASGRKLEISGAVEPALCLLDEKMREGKVALLVTGDPGISSLAAPAIKRFGAERCRVIAGVSSVQAAFAALGMPWTGARIISAHGGDPQEDGPPAERYAILLGRQESMAWAAGFASRLDGDWAAWICQDIGLESQKIIRTTPGALGEHEAPSLALVILSKVEE